MRIPIVVALLFVSAAVDLAGGPRTVPVYTNEDLDRLAPYRGQTGATSSPAVDQAPVPRRRGRGEGAAVADDVVRARKEAYWRREAEKVRLRLDRLRDEAADLRQRVADRPEKRSARLLEDPQVVAWKRRIALLEARVAEEEMRLIDRARRDGALPGWIR